MKLQQNWSEPRSKHSIAYWTGPKHWLPWGQFDRQYSLHMFWGPSTDIEQKFMPACTFLHSPSPQLICGIIIYFVFFFCFFLFLIIIYCPIFLHIFTVFLGVLAQLKRVGLTYFHSLHSLSSAFWAVLCVPTSRILLTLTIQTLSWKTHSYCCSSAMRSKPSSALGSTITWLPQL